MNFITNHSFATWEALIGALSHLKGDYVFRGMADADWRLQTSLERWFPDAANRAQTESMMLWSFQNRCADYLVPGREPTNDLEWLALMQHHGAPTRLLDFTKSPYIAAFFAFEAPGDMDRAIWVLDRHKAYTVAGDWAHREAGSEFSSGGWFTGVGVSNQIPILLNMADQTLPESPMVVVAESSRESGRLAVQQGLFAWPRNIALSFEDNLRALGDGTVARFTISGSLRPRIMEELRYMNITATSLFPGLDGFARSLCTHLIAEDRETIRLRRAIVDSGREIK